MTEPWGALLPFGEHKGSGLAIVCELLGGALTGGGTTHGTPATGRRVYNGMLTVLIDPQRIGSGADAFFAESAAFVESLRRSPPAPGFDRVRIAGEPEREARERRLAEGIPVDSTTWEEILLAGEKVGVARSDTVHRAGLQ